MASPPPTTQKASRWGAFLAGVESRLDTILADEDQPTNRPKPESIRQVPAGQKESMPPPPSGQKAAGESISRPSSTSRAQDRLNERLARAMANRNFNRMNDKSPATSSLPTRTASPANGIASPRLSTEVKRDEAKIDQSLTSTDSDKDQNGLTEPKELGKQQQPKDISTEAPTTQIDESKPGRQSLDSHRSNSVRPSLDLPRTPTEAPISPKINGISTGGDGNITPQYQQTIEQMRSDYEAAELRRQEETHMYLERIDALQSKLQYLTNEAAEIARTAKSEAEFGSNEEKLAAKDEKIALLMEEGRKLSQTELKHMSIIKKLRAKATEDDKRVAETKKLSEKHEKAAREAQERARRAEEEEKRASEQARGLQRLMEDLETMRADRDAQDTLIQDLQSQLAEATSAARQAEEKAQADALEAERKRTAKLADELSNVKSEKELAENQYQAELRELREKSEREKERARIAEIERQGEQNILESRLEAYRARAEEASAGSGGDVQAKLLRQIETLQNQYAVASENWQGIEGSLLARASTLEKERDEIAKRETDVRRKAREANMKSRRTEEELERVTAQTQDLEHETSQLRAQLAAFRDKLAKAVADASAARKELTAEREAWEAKQAQRLEEDRVRQQEESFRTTPDTLEQQFRTESPVTSGRKRKTSNAGKASSPHNNRRLHGLAITGAPAERPLSRRSSTQPLTHNSDHHRSLSRQDSMSFATQPLVNGAIPETPSIQIDNQDDFFDGVRTPATPERTINDMISVSTAGAGPSVQLVERMSAAVRRLESEKAAHKDELARLSAQQDEAREQIVGLMKEAEEKRTADAKAKKLEKEVEELNARYLTTLEMLGEKSEKVDELTADVADLKEMYRELVDRTMK
ncbi:MAG: hypothetical protein Q9225_001095 [Loekoesia sp. 1 TL-2023]